MTLSRKIFIRNIGLVAGVLLLSGAALTGLWRLREQVDVALDEYTELRLLATAETRALEAEVRLAAAMPDRARAADDLSRAADSLTEYLALQLEADEGSAGHERREKHNVSVAEVQLRSAAMRLRQTAVATETSDEERKNLDEDIGSAIRSLQLLQNESDTLVARTAHRASDGVRDTLLVVLATSLVIVTSTIIIGALQHRGVILPLRALAGGVRDVAKGRFSERLKPAGEQEFSRLAEEFNRMAEELDGLYRGLEEKVATKSRELVRSERLASVGFLAAGVAHEINNPLHIISGYAELSIKRLASVDLDGAASDADRSAAMQDAEQTLRIIREESFRCKAITEKLLSLSQPSALPRQHTAISLMHAARDVVQIVQAHKACVDREVILRVGDGDPLAIYGSEPELKQVILNLTINALEAVDAHTGVVTIEGRRLDDWVELRVVDNGCGMSPGVLEHVFEPFFSDKRESGSLQRRGLGLGLSISHAIIEGLGGTLTAASPAAGSVGSQFTIRLPAIAPLAPAEAVFPTLQEEAAWQR